MFDTIDYTIRPYDTIWMLAQVFNTSVDSIMELNKGIDPRKLSLGQVIKIRPDYQKYPQNHNAVHGMGYSVYPTEMGNDNMLQYGTDMENYLWYDDTMFDDLAPDQMIDIMNHLRRLWEEHVAWTRMAVMGMIHQLPESSEIIARLLRNPSDFSVVFEEYYGTEAAERFKELMTEHLTIAAELVKAAMDENQSAYENASQRWRENAEAMAQFLASINPYWHDDDWSAMLNEHLDLLENNIKQMLEGQYEESINGYDEIEMQALEMADIMADGIMRQFSGMEE